MTARERLIVSAIELLRRNGVAGTGLAALLEHSGTARRSVYVNFRIEDAHVEVEVQVDTVDRTGVEMEALTACSVAALTIYDMCKSVDRSMTISDVALWEKTGGRSGTYRRPGGDVESHDR